MKTTVYALINIITGELYIGCTTRRLSVRWSEHQSKLNAGKRASSNLLKAWQTYGSDAFLIAELESLDSSVNKSEREQWWCDHYRQKGIPLYNRRIIVDKNTGMDMPVTFKETIGSKIKGMKRSEETKDKIRQLKHGFTPRAAIDNHTFDWQLISPDGSLVDIHNLNKFCRENGLDNSCMRRVAIGEKKSYKGWTKVPSNVK